MPQRLAINVYRRFNLAGVTLIELLISLAIASTLLVGLHQLVLTGFAAQQQVDEQTKLARSARFAMARMVDAVAGSSRLLIPIADDPSTLRLENIRVKRVNVASISTAVLAVTVNPSLDIDNDGVADADNDGDGRIDEDLPADTSNDGEPGLRGFDDDGNGTLDFFFSPSGDDDESSDLRQSEDPINGIDDDGDGAIDEDPGSDNNGDGAPGVLGVDDDGDGQIDEGSNDDNDEDGLSNEDWYDPVAFYLNGDSLIERRAVPWDTSGDNDVTGRDYVESILVENVSYLRIERLENSGFQDLLVHITLELTTETGAFVSLATQMRLGAAQ